MKSFPLCFGMEERQQLFAVIIEQLAA